MSRLLSFASLKRAVSTCSSSTRHIAITTRTTVLTRRSSSANNSNTSSRLLRVLPEVRDAISSGRPVVALESTILAHGLPHPENIVLAKEVSRIIRSKGAIPATVAIKNGQCRVGLTEEELCDLAIAGVEKRAVKCSTRDIPLILSSHHRNSCSSSNDNNGSISNSSMSGLRQVEEDLHPHQWGATTVASTMRLAHLAGISTFVTGGTGGVHRGGENTLDISTDLLELSRTPVIVVSAGIKSILDIPRTLETLETYSVPTAVFGSTSISQGKMPDFPAFFSPTSGISAPFHLETPFDVARAYQASRDLHLPNGLLLAVPNYNGKDDNDNDTPSTNDGELVETAILESLKEAERRGIIGRDVTPFVLKRVAEKTEGESLRSNIALVKRNASVGADVAIAVAELGSSREGGLGSPSSPTGSSTNKTTTSTKATNKSRVLVMGGSVIDLVAKPHHHHNTTATTSNLVLGTSNPGTLLESDGGVARNITEVLARLNAQPTLYSSVGDDARGRALHHRLTTTTTDNDDDDDDDNHRGGGIQGVEQHVHILPNTKTPTYLAVLNQDGNLHVGIAADMEECLENTTSIPDGAALGSAEILILDGNPRVETLVDVAREARLLGVERVMFEPTSIFKARRVVSEGGGEFLKHISYAFPNEDELFAMAVDDNDNDNDGIYVIDEDYFERYKEVMDGSPWEQNIRKAATKLLSKMNPDGHAAYLIVTLGAEGAMLCSRFGVTSSSSKTTDNDDTIEFRYRPARVMEMEDVKNCTGAGDTLVGAFAKALLDGKDNYRALEIGMEAAIESLKCGDRAIPTTLR